MKSLSILFAMFFSSLAFAQTDIQLPQEKWAGQFTKFVCDDSGQAVSAPTTMSNMNVNFEMISTDRTLDNALLRATFTENGRTCRYNAVLFADNANNRVQLVQSLAFTTEGEATAYRDCVQGKEVLDQLLLDNEYLYYGHPHNLAIMAPMVDAANVCGEGAEFVGINFGNAGKL